MIIKIIKSLLFLTIIGSVSYYLVFTDNNKKDQKEPAAKMENAANLIEYRVNLKGGKLLIKAAKANIRDLGLIELTNMSANYKTSAKNVEITSKKCSFLTKEKKALLKDGVNIKSDELSIQTESATIDWAKQTIYGDARIIGIKQNIKFTASAFSVKEDGKILLKNAKMIQGNK